MVSDMQWMIPIQQYQMSDLIPMQDGWPIFEDDKALSLANLNYQAIKQFIFTEENEGKVCITLEALWQWVNRSWSGYQKNFVLFSIVEYDLLGFLDDQTGMNILNLFSWGHDVILQTLLLLEVLGGRKIGSKYVKSFIIIEPIFSIMKAETQDTPLRETALRVL